MTEREEFEKWFKKDFHYEKSGPYVKNMLLEAWQAAKAVPEWIPVSERLPENNSGLYLCSGHEGTKFVCYRRHREWIRSPQMKRVVGITHWMPITPAPVQAKDGE
jgi:hypothetical protein